MRTYDDKAVTILASALAGSDEALSMLQRSELMQLVAVYEHIVNDDEEALRWLIQHQFPELALFSRAVNKRDLHAVRELMKLGHPKWVAAINAGLGDKKAMQWLETYKLKGYAEIAKVLESKQLFGRRKGFFS